MLITFKCSNCGADCKAEDSKTHVFCEACGMKLTVPERSETPDQNAPAGEIVNDVAAEAQNGTSEIIIPTTVSGALDAYDRGDFDAANKAFTALAENDISVWGSRLFAGLASSALSKPLDLKIRDGLTAAKNAAAQGYSGDDKCDILTMFVTRVIAFAKDYSKTFYFHDKDYMYQDAYYAKDHFDGTCRMVEYLEACCDLMNQESLQRWTTLEEVKKNLIRETLEYIKEASKPIEYLIGYKTVIKGKDQIATEKVDQKMPCPFTSQYKNVSEKLKNAYNTVPTTVNRLKKYDEEIAANRSVIDDYKKSSDEYFARNPEDAKAYKRWRLFTSKKTINEIEARFPQELVNKKAAAQNSEAIVDKLVAERKNFEKENTI